MSLNIDMSLVIEIKHKNSILMQVRARNRNKPVFTDNTPFNHFIKHFCQMKYLLKSQSNECLCFLLNILDQTEEAWQHVGLGARLIR